MRGAAGARITLLLCPLVACLGLTACTGTDPRPVPLTFTQKIARWESASRVGWLVDTQNVGAKQFPDLTVQTASSGSQWELDVSLCLQHENTDTSTPDDALFVCKARHPKLSDLDRFLSDSQASVLYDYYVDSLQPCLLMAGQPVTTPPSRAVFLAENRRNETWSPWQSSRLLVFGNPQDSARRYRILQAQCPPAPKW